MFPCPGQFVPLTKSPSDSVQRRLLSIKMAVFMDGVCKNELLSTKRAVFMDKMWKWRYFGLKDSITWCKCGAKSKRKIANPWKSKTCDLKGTRSRSLVIVVYWGPDWPNCMKMRDFELVDTQCLQLIEMLIVMCNLQKMLAVVVWRGDQKWPTLNLCVKTRDTAC